ncbi:penicillin-binding protein 2 [Candidatus Woesebacteria bacterium]|nr:penicillin-binding protein 2 [Candidatus Woesebacteria bacterium]
MQHTPALHADSLTKRARWFFLFMCCLFIAVTIRLGYWQIIRGHELSMVAEDQYSRSITRSGKRGEIYTTDGHVLVTNEQVYRLFAQPNILVDPPDTVAKQLASLLVEPASTSADTKDSLFAITSSIAKQLNEDKAWVNLRFTVSEDTKRTIENLRIKGIGFDPFDKRSYPEASMAAHVLGFVGKNEQGQDLGYFGLEGSLEKELKARSLTNTVLIDTLGSLVQADGSFSNAVLDGRSVTTTLRRDVQHLAESQLKAGMEQYGARAGEIIIMEPTTGKILGLASFPNYDPTKFYAANPELYKNPSLTTLYEPGSTFKVLTVAAAIDAGVISRNTECTKCSGPREFGKYTIRTWNDSYNPGISMEQALAKSDNTAMIFDSELLGEDRFKTYLENFQIGKPIAIELQEDTSTPFPNRWGPVELATISFGQGITTNSLQMLRAIAAIANRGALMRPQIIEKVSDPLSGEMIENRPQVVTQVVSPQTAATVTDMLVTAAKSGEAQWIASRTHSVAGKTGTAQIPIEGGYAEDRTIASFVGFAPPHDPKFIMLVKLVEPTTSPWAAETAAPLWYKVADKLYLLLNIPPDIP